MLALAVATVKLTTFHQIVIGGAAGLAAVFALRSAYLFAQTRASRELALAFGALLLAAAALSYLRRFRARLR